ncbi:hypothetical protein ABPG75_008740 [Micractinium tetrahymenae]
MAADVPPLQGPGPAEATAEGPHEQPPHLADGPGGGAADPVAAAPAQQRPLHEGGPPSVERRKPGRPAIHSGCQVCGASLEGMRMFHQRYHICDAHMQMEQIMWKGLPQRFCQQCGRFHELQEFEGGMRSCRKQLAKHAERRRRGRERAAAERAAAQLAHGRTPSPTSASGPPAMLALEGTAPTAEQPIATAFAPAAQAPAPQQMHWKDGGGVPQQAQQAQVLQPMPAAQPACAHLPSAWRLADSSFSGASTGMHQSVASLSVGGLSALLSAAAAEEAVAAPGMGARRERPGEAAQEGQGRKEDAEAGHPRKQRRMGPEPEPSWFSQAPAPLPPTLPVPPQLSGSPLLSLLHAPVPTVTSINMCGAGLPAPAAIALPDGTAAAAAAPAAGLPASLALAAQQLRQLGHLQLQQQQEVQQLQRRQQLQALQQAAAQLAGQLVAPTPPPPLLPQHATLTAVLQLALQQQQQHCSLQPADALAQGSQQLVLQRLQAAMALPAEPAAGLPAAALTALLPQAGLAAGPALPGVNLLAQLVQGAAPQREPGPALFQAAVEGLLQGILGSGLPPLH